MEFPKNIEEINNASPTQILKWNRFLQPNSTDQVEIVNLIFNRMVKLRNDGQIDSTTSKQVGW